MTRRTPLITALTLALLSSASFAQIQIPLLKDGQVISADTFNDIFEAINRGSGIANATDLAGTWSCKTDDFSGQTPTTGMPNENFVLDATTGYYSATNTWVINATGSSAETDLYQLGGIANNNTGV